MIATSTSSHFPTIHLHLRSAFCYLDGASYNQSSFIKRNQLTSTGTASTWSRTPDDASQATNLEPDRHHWRLQYPSTKTATQWKTLEEQWLVEAWEKKKPLSRYIPSFRNKAILKIELGMGAGQNCRNSKLVNTFQTSSILVNKNPTPPRPTAKEQDLNPFSTALGWTWHLLEDRGEVEHQEQVNGNTVFLLFYTA